MDREQYLQIHALPTQEVTASPTLEREQYLYVHTLSQDTPTRPAVTQTSQPQADAKATAPTVEAIVSTYEVAKGDTALDVAKNFNLDINTLIWANNLGDGNSLHIGYTLLILPVDGMLHIVEEGDTVESIAQRYKVTPEAILKYAPNHLSGDESLSTYAKIIVPGGRLEREWEPVPTRRGSTSRPALAPAPSAAAPSGAGAFIWPTQGPITNRFHSGHAGIDIAPPYGTPIYAAAAGRVVAVNQWSWSYGWHIAIDHGNGLTTLYSHNSQHFVNVGDYVEQGQAIARVGRTGKSTGPHLHFEIRVNGKAVDPIRYLP